MQADTVPVRSKTGTSVRSKLARQESLWGWFFVAPWVIGFVIFTLGPVLASLAAYRAGGGAVARVLD